MWPSPLASLELMSVAVAQQSPLASLELVLKSVAA